MCSDHLKCTLFRSFCTSLYTCQLWCIINLNRSENGMLHTITCLDYYAMNQGIAGLVIGKIVVNFYDVYS